MVLRNASNQGEIGLVKDTKETNVPRHRVMELWLPLPPGGRFIILYVPGSCYSTPTRVYHDAQACLDRCSEIRLDRSVLPSDLATGRHIQVHSNLGPVRLPRIYAVNSGWSRNQQSTNGPSMILHERSRAGVARPTGPSARLLARVLLAQVCSIDRVYAMSETVLWVPLRMRIKGWM